MIKKHSLGQLAAEMALEGYKAAAKLTFARWAEHGIEGAEAEGWWLNQFGKNPDAVTFFLAPKGDEILGVHVTGWSYDQQTTIAKIDGCWRLLHHGADRRVLHNYRRHIVYYKDYRLGWRESHRG